MLGVSMSMSLQMSRISANGLYNKKIRNAQLNQVSFIGVIGQDEVDNGTIDVRDRDSNSSIGKLTVNGFVAFLNSHLPKPSEAKEKMVSKAYYEETIEVTHKYSQKELNDTSLSSNRHPAGSFSQVKQSKN